MEIVAYIAISFVASVFVGPLAIYAGVMALGVIAMGFSIVATNLMRVHHLGMAMSYNAASKMKSFLGDKR